MDQSITAQEIAFYRKTPIAQIEQQVEADRLSVQAVVVLDKFYSWARANPTFLEISTAPGPAYGQWVTRYPISSGMWPLDIQVMASMFDPNVWRAWSESQRDMGTNFTHGAVLHCKVGEYRAIVRELLPGLAL